MASPAMAHYGTTIIEEPAPAGVDQRAIPDTGALAARRTGRTTLVRRYLRGGWLLALPHGITGQSQDTCSLSSGFSRWW